MDQIDEEKNKVIKHLELIKIKELVESSYGFKLEFKNRHRELIYALKVYSQLARNRKHTYESISKSVGKTHATIMFHYNSFHTIEPYDLKIYNDCLDVINDYHFGYDTDYDSIILKRKDKIIFSLESQVKKLEEKIKDYENAKKILDMFDGWTLDQQNDFIEYRLKPYSKLINVKNK